MAARVSRRAVDVPEDLELPTIEAPQYVDENGYEVAAETFAQALLQGAEPRVDDHRAGSRSIQDTAIVSEEVMDGDENEEIGDIEAVEEDEVEEEEEAVEEEEPESRVPLLSLSDSNVLHYSLKATRQHHLKHLLPHMFSHPVIPANSRPRARPPPKGTFLWPTPPPLVHPLPNREYHAPTKTPSSNTAASTPPVGDGTPEPPAGTNDLPGTIKRKYGRGKGKGKEKMDVVEAPAHEIECLARVTLSIGPISFPDTELWVGRFVQQRAAAPKPPKMPREKQERKRPTAAADGAGSGPKRPRMKPGPVPRQPAVRPTANPPYHPAAGPSNYRPPPRPVGAPGPPYPGQFGQPGPPGPPRPPPPRAELSPDLIRRVNEAATKHPWLSQIIHKAARTQATKEELAKLGRVVNRLKEGKDVGEGPDDPASLPAQNRPLPPATGSARPVARPPTIPTSAAPVLPPPPQPTSSTVQSSVSGPSTSTSNPPRSETLPVPQAGADMSRTLSNSSGPLTPPPNDGESDDEGDVDMSGPRQVGGGPGGLDPALIDPTLKDGADPRLPPPSAAIPAPAPPNNPAQHASGTPNVASSTPVQPSLTTYRPSDSSAFSAPSQYRPPNPSMAPLYAQSRPPYPYPQQYPPGPGTAAYTSASPAPPPPPPPPRPTYPLPPPFLLVAFKEAPTEKFLLPLGSLSYISRQGGDPEPLQPLPKPLTPTPIPTQATPVPVSDSSLIATNTSLPIKSRTRASLGKGAKVPTPEPQTPPAKPEPTVESPDVPKKPEPPRSGLNPLPGTQPAHGTVLLSTFIPAGEWQKPDWNALSVSLPFNNPLFEPKIKPATEVKVESPSIVNATANGEVTASPKSTTKRKSKASEESNAATGNSPDLMPVRGKLLNLAAESFIPEESEVHAVTIRLGDVTDAVWQRIKTISGMIVTAEMKSLAEQEPSLMATSESSKPASEVKSEPLPSVGGSMTTNLPPPAVPAPSRPGFQPSPELKESYLERKRNWFRSLLERVPARKFLRFRLSSPRQDIIDATTDKWAPRPYPISTKALYAREEEENAEELLLLSPELQPKRGNKKLPEPTVTFEMPVSLDQLDERVAESTMSGKKLKGEDGRKRHGKRWVPGTICEGCGQSGKRVWRAGPGGKGTLCNSCGDKWTSGILGPLVAPSASNKDKEADEKDENDAATAPGVTDEHADSKTTGSKVLEADKTVVVDPALNTDPKPIPAPVPDQPTEISVPARVSDTHPDQRNDPTVAGNADADADNAQTSSNDAVNDTQTQKTEIIRTEGDDAMDVDPPHSLQVDPEQTGVKVPNPTVDTTD